MLTSTPSKKKDKLRNVKQRYAIVVSKFNEFITNRLLKACLDEFHKHGVLSKNVLVVWVPGAFEIPLTALKLARKRNISAVVCLGAIIRGETLHYELVAKETAAGIMRVSLMSEKPIVFEVLATDTIALAQKRSEDKGDNKGRDAAQTALQMTQVLETL